MFVKVTKIISLLLCLLLVLGLFTGCGQHAKRLNKTFVNYFDTAITVIGYDREDDFNEICDLIEQNLSRYHKLFDIYNGYEGIVNLYTVNKEAGKQVRVEAELLEFIEYCKDMYNLTNGKTNIAMGSVLSIWHESRQSSKLPDMKVLSEAAGHMDIEKVIVNPADGTIQLLDPQMSLDVGAIAKGYALERIINIVKEKGITSYAINAGGMVKCIGFRGDRSAWSVGIENPNDTTKLIAAVFPQNLTLVTSGTYQRYFEVDGVRYHHIINPDTLKPENNYLSVSVLTENSALGDALSTALFNMTVEDGKALLQRLDSEVEAMWVLPDETKIFTDGFSKFIKE